ncbi:MAG: galactokinase [Bacteroidota bacterium]
MELNDRRQEFEQRFAKPPEHIFFCPGRVNLIGEHIDYNGGRVMPCAISLGIYLAVSKNTDKRLRFQSLNFPETADLHLQESYSKTGGQWFNYPLGVINELVGNGYNLSGLDMLFYGNLPIGAGLSSSASIEVLTGFAISDMFGLGIPAKQIAILCKEAENRFVGVNCGIMDQFAVAMGVKDMAIILNCDTLEYEYLPFQTGDCSLVIINSNKQRTLADSKYNERFAECGAALKSLNRQLPAETLCGINLAEFELNRHLIVDPVLQKRALHVVSENVRVNDAAMALQTGDLEVFGKLMYASHQSLKDLYDVTGLELDTIVGFCKNYNGCIGARMTGAGFGGCAIALVNTNSLDDFSAKLSDHYSRVVGYAPEIFAAGAEEGVSEFKY